MVTHEEFEKATHKATRQAQSQPRVVAVRYESGLGKLVIELSSGLQLLLTPALLQEFEKATAADLAASEISASGLGIYFPALDADIYLPGLLAGFLGSKKWMAAKMGTEGGRSRSEAKVKAAKANGLRGGRPPKTTVAEMVVVEKTFAEGQDLLPEGALISETFGSDCIEDSIEKKRLQRIRK